MCDLVQFSYTTTQLCICEYIFFFKDQDEGDMAGETKGIGCVENTHFVIFQGKGELFYSNINILLCQSHKL